MAKEAFKEEIAMRISRGFGPTMIFMIEDDYINYLSKEELESILGTADIIDIIIKAVKSEGMKKTHILELSEYIYVKYFMRDSTMKERMILRLLRELVSANRKESIRQIIINLAQMSNWKLERYNFNIDAKKEILSLLFPNRISDLKIIEEEDILVNIKNNIDYSSWSQEQIEKFLEKLRLTSGIRSIF